MPQQAFTGGDSALLVHDGYRSQRPQDYHKPSHQSPLANAYDAAATLLGAAVFLACVLRMMSGSFSRYSAKYLVCFSLAVTTEAHRPLWVSNHVAAQTVPADE